MLKTVKPAIYLAVIILIIAAVGLALIASRTKSPAPARQAQNFQPIEGAQANSYEAVAGIGDVKSGDLVIGSEQATLKILVYEDYANVFSAELAATLEQLVSEYDGKIALIVRPFVLLGSSDSQAAAKAFLCSQENGKGQAARERLFELINNGGLSEGWEMALAKDLKINEGKFAACLTNQDKSVKLEEATQEARRNLVLGAPTMLVGDELILGARPYADFIDSNGDAVEGLKTVVARKLGANAQ